MSIKTFSSCFLIYHNHGGASQAAFPLSIFPLPSPMSSFLSKQKIFQNPKKITLGSPLSSGKCMNRRKSASDTALSLVKRAFFMEIVPKNPTNSRKKSSNKLKNPIYKGNSCVIIHVKGVIPRSNKRKEGILFEEGRFYQGGCSEVRYDAEGR